MAATLLGLLLGRMHLFLVLSLAAYFTWHVFNLLLLQTWIARRRGFRLPVSLGVWESVFNGLQREQMRRRRRSRGLIASLSDYREAAQILPDALVVLSNQGTVRWFNAAARELLGLRRPDGVGVDITRILKHPVLEDDLAKGRSSRPLEIVSPANGAWMLSLQVTAPFGNQSDRLLIARNITPSFRLEQVRRDFLASVSHELRTPITVFRGYLEMLQEALAGDVHWRTPLGHMDQQVRRMQSLVDDLLMLSRLEMTDRPKEARPVPVSEILTQIITEARTLSGDRKHDIRLDADPEVWLKGEESELHSAFSNLIFNAVRHTAPGTRVDVAWSGHDEEAILSVTDYGPGIAAYHLPRLSERFYRVEAGRSRDSGGSGLGLAIVKQVLERYSSELEIASEVDKGSTFSCRFPGNLVEIKSVPVLSKTG
jgi:two-component system phosphate regulon sensor histidine kinase PhoR